MFCMGKLSGRTGPQHRCASAIAIPPAAKADRLPVSIYYERIANRLARAGQRNPNSTLQTVTVGSNEVKMIWRIETARSRNG
jgi:hypothetical protein